MNNEQYAIYNARVRNAALKLVEQAIAEVLPADSKLSDDLKFWMHFELIRHLSARFAASNYAIHSKRALEYLHEEIAAMHDELSSPDWPRADAKEMLSEAAAKPEFFQHAMLNSSLLAVINGERVQLFDADENFTGTRS